MDEYFNRDKFTGGQSPRPPKKDPNDNGWISWPLVIILFAMGLWPVALAVLFFGFAGSAKKAANKDGSTGQTAAQQAIARARQKAAEAAAAGKAANAANAANTTNAAGTVKAAGKKKQKKAKEMVSGNLLRILGIVFLSLGAIIGVDAVASLLQGYSGYLEDLIQGLAITAAGGIMWGRGLYLRHITRRSQRYILAIGSAEVMPLSEIAKRVNRSEAQTENELQKLIDKGYLGEDAYIDHQKGYLLRFGAAVEEEKKPEETPKQAQEGYDNILQNIRRANDLIADEELSRKIDRLEQISRLIFREVEEHPEKRARIRTFFDYYLPTTQKLLDTYAEFEATGVEGEHLNEAKQRIEQTMDTIVEGFEHQLDQLYSADAMDVVSDIKVMESMLSRDTASAARDFGYPPEKNATPKGQQGGGMQQAEQ